MDSEFGEVHPRNLSTDSIQQDHYRLESAGPSGQPPVCSKLSTLYGLEAQAKAWQDGKNSPVELLVARLS